MKKKIISITLCVLLVLLSLPLSAMAEKATEGKSAPQAAEQAVQEAAEPAAQQVEETTADEAITETLPQNLEAAGDETDTTVTENGTTVESKVVDAADAAVDAPETLALPTGGSSDIPLTYGDFGYRENADGTVVITCYSGNAEKIDVPATINGKKVIKVEALVFANQTVREIVIPEGVDAIGYTPFNNCPNLTKITLPSTLKGSLYIYGSGFTNTEDFKKATGLTELGLRDGVLEDITALSGLENLKVLNVSGNKIKSISGLKNLPALEKLSLEGNTEITDLSPLKDMKNLTQLYLGPESKATPQSMAEMMRVSDQEIRTVDGEKSLLVQPMILSGPNLNSDRKFTIEPENAQIASTRWDSGQWKLQGLKTGETKGIFKYDGKNVGAAFNIKVTGLSAEADQPVGEKIENLPTIGAVSVPGGNEILSLTSNGQLWNVSGEKPEMIKDNVKKYVGMSTYVGISEDSSKSGITWTMIEDNDGTLWTREIKGKEAPVLNKRVQNVVKYVGMAAYGSNGIINGYALDQNQKLWNMGGNNTNQIVQTDIKDFDALGFNEKGIGIAVLKQNGDLFVRLDPSTVTSESSEFEKIESNVTSLEADEHFIKNGVLYGYFLDMNKGKVEAVDISESFLTTFVKGLFAVKGDGTTWYRSDNFNPSYKILDTVAEQVAYSFENGQNAYLLLDKNNTLWKWVKGNIVTTDEIKAEKIAENVRYMDSDCYVTENDDRYSLTMEKLDSGVKKVIQVGSANNHCILKNDGMVYRNGVAILNHVDDMTVDALETNWYNGVCFVRTDGSVWYMNIEGDPTPYQKADNLGKIDVTGVKLDKNETTLTEGQEETLTAAVQPENATYKTVAWSSSNEKVATVDENGKVKAVSAGSAVITAKSTDGGKTANCKVTVKKPAIRVESVAIEGPDEALNIGFTVQLTASVQPENADNQNVSWSTADTGIATVDQSGKVTAVAAGMTKIRVTTEDGGKTAERDITVLAPKIEAEVPVTEIVDTPQAVPVANTTVTVSVPESVVEANPALEGATLVITSVKDSDADESAHVEALIKADAGLGEAYSLLQHLDFKFVDADGKAIAFDGEGGSVKVEIQLTDVQRSQFEAFRLYYRSSDGSLEFIADMTPDADGKVIADLPHFSEYVLVGRAKAEQPPVIDLDNPVNPDSNQNPASAPKDSGKTTVKNVGTGITGDANTFAYLCTGLLVLSIAGAFALRKRRKTEK